MRTGRKLLRIAPPDCGIVLFEISTLPTTHHNHLRTKYYAPTTPRFHIESPQPRRFLLLLLLLLKNGLFGFHAQIFKSIDILSLVLRLILDQESIQILYLNTNIKRYRDTVFIMYWYLSTLKNQMDETRLLNQHLTSLMLMFKSSTFCVI